MKSKMLLAIFEVGEMKFEKRNLVNFCVLNLLLLFFILTIYYTHF